MLIKKDIVQAALQHFCCCKCGTYSTVQKFEDLEVNIGCFQNSSSFSLVHLHTVFQVRDRMVVPES